jgi:hypothetical protein
VREDRENRKSLSRLRRAPYSEVLAENNSKVQELYTDQAGLDREREEEELPQCKEGKDPSREGIQLNRDGVDEALGGDSGDELEEEYGEDLQEMVGRALRGRSPLEITVVGVVVTGGEKENRIKCLSGRARQEMTIKRQGMIVDGTETSPELQLLIDTGKVHMKGGNKEHASELPPPEPPPEIDFPFLEEDETVGDVVGLMKEKAMHPPMESILEEMGLVEVPQQAVVITRSGRPSKPPARLQYGKPVEGGGN